MRLIESGRATRRDRDGDGDGIRYDSIRLDSDRAGSMRYDAMYCDATRWGKVRCAFNSSLPCLSRGSVSERAPRKRATAKGHHASQDGPKTYYRPLFGFDDPA